MVLGAGRTRVQDRCGVPAGGGRVAGPARVVALISQYVEQLDGHRGRRARRPERVANDTPVPDEWVRALSAAGVERERATARLHEMLLRVARAGARRRSGQLRISGPRTGRSGAPRRPRTRLLAIIAKIGEFRGESRFTTWACKFVIFEVSGKIGRHFWRHPAVPLEAGDWDRLPDRYGLDPGPGVRMARPGPGAAAGGRGGAHRAPAAGLHRDLGGRHAADALVAELGSSRNALYKTMFDARRKLRASLVANGYLHESPVSTHEQLACPGPLPADRPARRGMRHGDANCSTSTRTSRSPIPRSGATAPGGGRASGGLRPCAPRTLRGCSRAIQDGPYGTMTAHGASPR